MTGVDNVLRASAAREEAERAIKFAFCAVIKYVKVLFGVDSISCHSENWCQKLTVGTMPRFKQSKAAQVAAFFAQAEGGKINVLKLIKLMYLADRRFMQWHKAPILYDNFYSLDHGPVGSMSYDLLQGNIEDSREWDQWITDRANHEVGLNRSANRADLDQISDAEFETLSEIWKQFGHMNQWAIRDWTHRNCREWKDPHGSSLPFDYEDVFVAFGMDRPEAGEIQEKLEEDKRIAKILDRV